MTKVILLFCLANQCFGQNKNHDDLVYQAVVRKAGKDINEAFKMADSLYKVSEEPLKKVKALMLLAELNINTGNNKKGINYAFSAQRITTENNLYEWEARICGFLASHYRSVGLKKQSKRYIARGLEVIKHVKDVHIANQYKGLAFQEFALYETENKNFKKAIYYLEKAEPCFEYVRNADLKQYQLAVNHGMFGRAYMHLEDTDPAVSHFTEALHHLGTIKNEAAVLKGFMFEGLGRTYLENGNLEEASAYLTKALTIADQSEDMNLKLDVYCDMAIYHIETKNVPQYKHYNNLYLSLLEKAKESDADSSEILVNRLQEREDILVHRNLWAVGIFILVLTVLTVIIVFSRLRRKKEYKKFTEIIKDLQERKETEHDIKVISLGDTGDKSLSDKDLMSKDVEYLILEKLQLFESGNDFTNNSITLSSLSVMLETNSKYLSYVINKNKKKDFNNYINELRILYIIRKLESSPEYLNYKISYLAEECGFSSHSKFTDKFKIVTQMSPSTFIRFLKKAQENQAV